MGAGNSRQEPAAPLSLSVDDGCSGDQHRDKRQFSAEDVAAAARWLMGAWQWTSIFGADDQQRAFCNGRGPPPVQFLLPTPWWPHGPPMGHGSFGGQTKHIGDDRRRQAFDVAMASACSATHDIARQPCLGDDSARARVWLWRLMELDTWQRRMKAAPHCGAYPNAMAGAVDVPALAMPAHRVVVVLATPGDLTGRLRVSPVQPVVLPTQWTALRLALLQCPGAATAILRDILPALLEAQLHGPQPAPSAALPPRRDDAPAVAAAAAAAARHPLLPVTEYDALPLGACELVLAIQTANATACTLLLRHLTAVAAAARHIAGRPDAAVAAERELERTLNGPVVYPTQFHDATITHAPPLLLALRFAVYHAHCAVACFPPPPNDGSGDGRAEAWRTDGPGRTRTAADRVAVVVALLHASSVPGHPGDIDPHLSPAAPPHARPLPGAMESADDDDHRQHELHRFGDVRAWLRAWFAPAPAAPQAATPQERERRHKEHAARINADHDVGRQCLALLERACQARERYEAHVRDTLTRVCCRAQVIPLVLDTVWGYVHRRSESERPGSEPYAVPLSPTTPTAPVAGLSDSAAAAAVPSAPKLAAPVAAGESACLPPARAAEHNAPPPS